MSIKWRLTALFLATTGLSLFLFWVGESALMKGPALHADPRVIALSLLIPGFAVFYYAGRLSQRIQSLSFTTRRIAQGDFERVNFSDSTDEVGQFTLELNRLARQIEVIVQKGTQEAHKMETILAGMQEGVIALDHLGRIVLLNTAAEKIFACDQKKVHLKYLFEFIHHHGLDEIVNQVLQGEPSGNIELNLEQHTVRVQVNPIINDKGNPRGAVIVCHDVTELRRLEKVRTEFVANVSHELRTPLTSIKGFVETLIDGAADIPSLRERFLNVIQAETLRLQRLIDDLLTLSRIENRDNRRGDLIPRVSFVQEAYQKIQPVIQSYAEAKGIQLEVKLDHNLPVVAIGEDLLSQVLLNLLENAVKYTTEGQVWLKAQAEKDRLRIEFGDTGCGIPEESLPRIFERFYRVDKARSREQGGTGLGLSIVKHIIEGSGGKIKVISQLGKGTVFTCELPRA